MLSLMIGIYTLLASTLSILRYQSLLTQATDLGIFMQSLYSTLHGRLLFEQPDYQALGVTSFLGLHFSPILIAIVPLYAIFPYAQTLLILQAFVVAIGSVPSFLIAKTVNDERRALGFSAFYLAYAPLLGANLYDFHVEAFLPVLLLFTFYFVQTKRYPRSLIPILLSLATLEASPVLIGSMMLYFIMRDPKNWKSRKWELSLMLLMVPAYFFIRYIMGMFAPVQQFAAGFDTVSLIYLASDLPLKVAYLLAVLAAAGFLPILSPKTAIIALPWLATQFFSAKSFPHSIGWQYEFFLVPWIIVGSVYGLSSAGENWLVPLLKKGANTGVPTAKLFKVGLVTSLALSPAIPLATLFANPPFRGEGYIVSYSPSVQYPKIVDLVNEIGSGPILVSNHLFPYVAHNLEAYDFEPGTRNLGDLTRVPRLQYILVQEEDVNQLPAGLLTQFTLTSMIPSDDHSNIYLYQRLP